MDFYDIVRQVLELLQRNGRTSYRALKRQFNLDDEALEDLKEELLFAHPVIDEDERGLVWTAAIAPSEPDTQRRPEAESHFHAMLSAVMWWLQRDRRVTYRTLKHFLGLSDALLDDIRKELGLRQLASDEEGKILVWMGDAHPTAETPQFPAIQEAATTVSPMPAEVFPSTRRIRNLT
jgi:hypothetical protein